MNLSIKRAILYLRALILKRYYCVLQSDENDCGAAAVSTVAGHYGYWMNIEQAKELVNLNQSGQNLWDLAYAAEQIGFEGKPAHAIYSAIQQIPWPFIAHYKGDAGHYVVVYEVHNDYVVVANPAFGIEILTKNEFEEKWSHYIVEFRRRKDFSPRRVTVSPYTFFFELVKENKNIITILFFFTIIFSFFGVISSYFVKIIVDDILPSKEIGKLTFLGCLFIMFYGMQFLLGFFQANLQIKMGNRIQIDSLYKYFERIFFLPQRFYETHTVGNLVSKVFDTERIRDAIGENIIALCSDLIFMMVGIILMALHSVPLTLLVLSFLPVFLILVLVFYLPILRLQYASMEKQGEVSTSFIDTLTGVSEVKMSSSERYFVENIKKKAQAVIVNNTLLMRLSIVSGQTGSFFMSLLTVLLLWQGALLVFHDALSVGSLMFFFGLAAFVISPIQQVPAVYITVQDTLVTLERLFAIIKLPLEKEIFSGRRTLSDIKGKIDFENVSFGYRKDAMILKDINFSLKAGKTLAIVGETGVGKTTLAKLLCGFYKVNGGLMRIDGCPLEELSLEALRQHVGVVFQRSYLFADTLYKNLTMGKSISEEEIKKKFEHSGAFQFINELPQGLSTLIRPGGGNLSEGQIQRIAILRTLIKDPTILIFDEATSNLDSATEKMILEFLTEKRKGKTTIIIGHRLSTVAAADAIIVLDGGRIVEQGSLRELIDKKEYFYALFKTQLEAGSTV